MSVGNGRGIEPSFAARLGKLSKSAALPGIRDHGSMREERFERLFAEHAQPLFAFFVYRTGNRVLAEDLVADTFERVLRARARFDPRKGSAKSWIYSIGINLLRDNARRRMAEERALQRVGAEGPDQVTEMSTVAEQRDELGRALAQLGNAERDAIALRFGADLTLKEVARALGERPSVVEKRIYRALEKLRDDLS